VTFKEQGTLWKGTQLGYDKLIVSPDTTRECCYCLTDAQAQALLAAIDAFRYITRWYFQTEIDAEFTNNFVNDIQRRLMTPCGCDETGIIYAYNSDGVLTQSNNGGVSYTPVPEKDPRNNSPLFPPPMGEDPDKCPLADSAVDTLIVDIFDNLTPEMNRDDMDELIRAWVTTYINTSNPFIALLTVIVNLIIGLGVDLIIENLTSEVWAQLRCCFNDTMNDDFSYDTDAWEALRECITNEIGGIAGIFLEHLIFLAGSAGCTNLIRAGRGSEDADCDCTEYLRVYVSTGGGTEVDWDGEWLTMNPVADGDHYTGFFQTTDPVGSLDVNNCAHYEVELLSGTIDITNSAYAPCGSATLTPIGLTPLNELCSCQVALRNFEAVTFQIRVRGWACS